MRRTACVVAGLLLSLVVLGPVPAAHAGASDCVQACADQWFADKAACAERLNATLTAIAAAEEQCISACAPTNFLCQAQCVRAGNIKRGVANNEYRRCVNRANTTAWNCYRACEISKGRPR